MIKGEDIKDIGLPVKIVEHTGIMGDINMHCMGSAFDQERCSLSWLMKFYMREYELGHDGSIGIKRFRVVWG